MDFIVAVIDTSKEVKLMLNTIIGYGNMAQAIARGLVDAGVVTGGQMVACAARYDKLEKTTAELGVRPRADVVFIDQTLYTPFCY